MSGFFFLILLAAFSAAELPPSLADHECVGLAKKKLDGAKTWRRSVSASRDEVAFRAPSDQWGVWYELTAAKKHLTLRQITTAKVTEFHWDQDCKPSEISHRNDAFKKRTGSAFTDQDLRKILDQEHKAIIHVWSPDRVYSVKLFKSFKNISEKLGYKFFAVRDPYSDLYPPLDRDPLLSSAKTVLQSLELQMRDATIHYPTTFVVRDGKISRFPILGVFENEDELQQRILKEAAVMR